MTIFIISLVVLLSISCSEVESLDTTEILSPDSPLQISALTSSATKGLIVDEAKDMGSIGLYCSWTSSATANATESWKMENQRYNIRGDDWVIDGDALPWGFDSLNDKYTFFAYSPHNENKEYITPMIEAGELVIHYEVPPQSVNQPDLMYAMPRKDIFPQASGCVPLTFYHALSCISFSVSTATTTTITAIKMTGVISSGSLKWDYDSDPNVPCWDIHYPEDDEVVNYETFSVKVANYTADSDNAVQVNAKKGYLMMIPQVIGDNAQVTLTLSTGDEKTLTIPAHSEWEAGLKYRYTILLDEESGNDDDECDFLFNSTQLSNCYIINPTEGEETTVQIPIEDRINDFWVNHVNGSEKIKASNGTKKFIVTTVWEDFGTTLDYDYEVLDDSDNKMAVRFKFPAEFQEGNFVFAVEKKSGDSTTILWSWHLWFTNYRPDEIAEANRAKIVAGEDREYTFGDYNGAVHRYADGANSDVWSSSGMYGNKFIMDRNIGERSDRNTAYGEGTVYYQFGRKDPFPGVGGKYSGCEDAGAPGTRGSSSQTFEDSVDYVTAFFFTDSDGPGTWCGEDSARKTPCIWFDKTLPLSVYTEGKSIFDPSPLGWRVPVSETWSCFDSTTNGLTSWSSYGKYYYYGYRNSLERGVVTADCETGYVWSIDQYDYEKATCFSYSDTAASSLTTMYITYGLPIRAIEE